MKAQPHVEVGIAIHAWDPWRVNMAVDGHDRIGRHEDGQPEAAGAKEERWR